MKLWLVNRKVKFEEEPNGEKKEKRKKKEMADRKVKFIKLA